jgi:cell division septal protein FtsQ
MARRKKTYSRKKAFQKRKQGWQKAHVQRRSSVRKARKVSGGLLSKIYIILAGFLVVGALYILFYSPLFTIANIIVSDSSADLEPQIARYVEEDILDKRKWLIFSSRNIFLLPAQDIEKKIVEQFPEVYFVSASKDFPNVLRLNVKQREPVLVWKKNDNFYYVADDGVVIGAESAYDAENDSLPLIESLRDDEVVVGEMITNAKIIRFIQILEERFTSKTNIEIASYVLPSAQAGEIHIQSKEGTLVYFSLESSAEDQIDNLVLLVREELEGSISGLEYIDMRVGNWVYYK